jgi:hypothetical protein
MFLIVGIGPGFQGIRPALMAAGVGRDACDLPSNASSSHESCKAQGDLVDEYQALSVTIMNLLIMPVGVLADIFGLREIAWMGIVGWTLVMALKVVAPGGGSMYFFSETAANVFGVFVFFAVLNEYSAGVIICGLNRIAMGLATGGWDAGALTYVLMGFAYFSLSLPLELLFVIYALGVGSLFLVVVSVMFHRRGFRIFWACRALNMQRELGHLCATKCGRWPRECSTRSVSQCSWPGFLSKPSLSAMGVSSSRQLQSK